jgi:steroid 5-alpha reductase family enzyme
MTDFWFDLINYIWIAVALITMIVLIGFKIRAPYGRHSNTKWGSMIDNRWGWFLMELPAFLICPLLAIFGPSEKDFVEWLLIGLWSLHYFNRTIIFPIRLKTTGKKMPLVIVFSALFFNGMNGFLNGYFIGFMDFEGGEILSLNVILGLVLFAGGMLINQLTDSKLIALRKEQKGYQIPRKWLFEFISCPNHFGEIVEWAGFAIIAWSLPALTFSIWTFSNLLPRALNHHDWYRERFAEYPTKRKAVIPWLW